MRFNKTGPTGGDETAPYSVTDYQAKTIVEFIHEVMEQNPNEWGYIEVKDEHTRIEYRYGKLLDEIPDAWQSCEIGKVDAAGGWSRMDYFITAKRPYNYETTTTEKNNMTIQDIMIDDWVYIKDYPIKAQPQKVRPEHFVRSLVEFEPIPINKEILEKNGFVEDDNDDCWGDANCFFIPNYADKNIISWETHIEPDNGIGDFNGNLTYVHQLQHALKLCGIEKSIEL